MKIIENKFIPFRGFTAMMLFGILFTRDKRQVTEKTIRHEEIHASQMRELLYIGFYLWYLAEWIIRLFLPGRAYSNMAFEREAYAHAHDRDYLSGRKRFAFLTYYRKK